MIVDKNYPGLIDEGYRYVINGNLISDESIVISLDKSLYVNGSIKASWSIEAGGPINAGGSIKAGRYIKAGDSIEAGGSIESYGVRTEKYFHINGLTRNIYVFDNHLRIDCEGPYTKDEWASFSDDRIAEMDDYALEFWNENKKWLLAL